MLSDFGTECWLELGASSYELYKGLNLGGEDHVERCSSVWGKEWMLKAKGVEVWQGLKIFFPGLKINVKASIVLSKFMKKRHLGYLGVGYVSR